MLVYLRGWSAQTILCAATLRWKLQINLSTSPSQSILTPGWPVPALTLWCQAPGRVATGVPIFSSLVWLDPEKSCRKRDSNPRSSTPKADALTTRPVRRLKSSGPPQIYCYAMLCNTPLTCEHMQCMSSAPCPLMPFPLYLTQFPVSVIQMSQLCACKVCDSTQFFMTLQCMAHESQALD